MTIAQLVQLYAPLAGLLILAFWVGRLGQKVDDLKEDVETLKAARAEDGAEAKFARIEEQMISVKDTLQRMELRLNAGGLHVAPPLG